MMLKYDEVSGTKECLEGSLAARKDFESKTKCPYKVDTPEYAKWELAYFHTMHYIVYLAKVAGNLINDS